MRNYKLITVLAMTSLSLSGCGDFEKDPLENHRKGIPDQGFVEPVKNPKNSFFVIKNLDHLNFTENVERTVRFSVEIAYSNPAEVRYDLIVSDNQYIKQNLLSRSIENPNIWLLKWMPSPNTTSPLDGTAAFDIQLKFALSPTSTPAAHAALAGLVLESEPFQISVQREQDQPQIEKIEGFFPGAVANPGQDMKIAFVVSAKLSQADFSYLQFNERSGPEKPSSELVLMDARSGIESSPKLIKFLENSEDGRTRARYEYTFKPQAFIDRILTAIRANPKLLAEFNSGELTEAEAQFGVVAVNNYNNKSSVEKLVNFKVNLLGQAVPASIAGDETSIVAKGSAESKNTFFIQSGDERSQIQILGLSLAGQDLSLTNNKSSAQVDGVSLEVDCSGGTPGTASHFNCKIGECFKMCDLKVSASCEAEVKSLPLIFHTESRWGKDVLTQELKYTINVQNSASCAASPAATATAQGVN